MASPQLEEGDRGMLPYCVTGLGAPLHRDRVSCGTICHVLATSLYDDPAAGVCGDAPAGLDEHPEHGLRVLTRLRRLAHPGAGGLLASSYRSAAYDGVSSAAVRTARVGERANQHGTEED